MAYDQSLVFLIIFYIIAFIYVKEPHYKFFGYILLTIVYLFSIIIFLNNKNVIITRFNEAGLIPALAQSIFNLLKGFGTIETITSIVQNGFILSLILIVVFNIYSLFRILNAYWFRTKTMKSFDLKLSEHHKKNLVVFDNSFIVGNTSFGLFIISLLIKGEPLSEKIKNIFTNQKFQGLLYFISFVCVWIETDYSTRFTYIKRD
jgi:hypothetical protein